ncbi:CLUMA_CG015305, isoform A [Clunio marinus]|uniref:CLUMA_CG015305, isoform A n=1 Tax=Clunio marinus TaxID=568069 RepID=A0A1J1IR36_9DIPT|nr:CLUMA_CG015305, isoform A [Clunio marinus]
MQLESVLPEEILLEIFSETESNDLKKFLEISNEWRNLLIQNVRVMRKLPLMMMNETWKEKLNFVESYGKYIRVIEFVETNFASLDDVAKILQCTPNVEKLSFIRVTNAESQENSDQRENDEEEEEIIKNQEIVSEKIVLKRLRKIEVIDDQSANTLNFIATQLECGISSLKCTVNDDNELKILEKILQKSHRLKVLELTSQVDNGFTPPIELSSEFDFQLEKLSIKTPIMKHNQQLIKFMTTQKYLKEIEIISNHVDFVYHQMIFTQFPFAKSLSFNIDNLASTDCLVKLRKVLPNKNLKSLNLSGKNFHLNIFDEILRIAPKTSKLHVENFTHFISDRMQTLPLTYLEVGSGHFEYLITKKEIEIKLINVIPIHSRQIYERNLQNFCDLTQFCDKNKDIDVCEY